MRWGRGGPTRARRVLPVATRLSGEKFLTRRKNGKRITAKEKAKNAGQKMQNLFLCYFSPLIFALFPASFFCLRSRGNRGGARRCAEHQPQRVARTSATGNFQYLFPALLLRLVCDTAALRERSQAAPARPPIARGRLTRSF